MDTFDIHINFPCQENFKPIIDFRQLPFSDILNKKESYSQNLKYDKDKYLKSLINDLTFKFSKYNFSPENINKVYFTCNNIDDLNLEFMSELQDSLELLGVKNKFKKILSIAPIFNQYTSKQIGKYNLDTLIIRTLTFNKETLSQLPFEYDFKSLFKYLYQLKELSIDNLGLELLYAIPGEEQKMFRNDLEFINQLSPEHISAYPYRLKVREKSIKNFIAKISSRKIEVDPELRERMKKVLINNFEFTDHEHYHIYHFKKRSSNFNYELYNLGKKSYIGLGAGAISRFINKEGERIHIFNTNEPNKYIKTALSGFDNTTSVKKMSLRNCIYEYIYSNLITINGLSKENFKSNFNIEIDDLLPGLINALDYSGYLLEKDNNIILTEKGMIVADNIIRSFMSTSRDIKELLKK